MLPSHTSLLSLLINRQLSTVSVLTWIRTHSISASLVSSESPVHNHQAARRSDDIPTRPRSSFRSFVSVRIDQWCETIAFCHGRFLLEEKTPRHTIEKPCSAVLFFCKGSFFLSRDQVKNEAIFVCITFLATTFVRKSSDRDEKLRRIVHMDVGEVKRTQSSECDQSVLAGRVALL